MLATAEFSHTLQKFFSQYFRAFDGALASPFEKLCPSEILPACVPGICDAIRVQHQEIRSPVPNENSVWRAGGFSVRTVTRRAARVANLRTEPENLRTSEHRCKGCGNGRLKIMSTYRYSGCSSFVAMVHSTRLANGHDPPDFGWLNRARFG